MRPILVSDLVRPLFRATQGDGTVAMLHCYFDDSGTHAGAPSVVWGGLIGKPDAFDKLNALWMEILKAPMASKTSLRKMRMSSLCSSQGDFVGYKPVERDVLRKRFRDAILECDLEAIAYVANAEQWMEISTEVDRRFLGNAENFVFRRLLDAIAKIALAEGGQLSCHFDNGAQNIGTQTVTKLWKLLNPTAAENCHFVYSEVASIAALQAADMIAYEAYHYALHRDNPTKVSDNPHFVRLREGMNVLFEFLDGDVMATFLPEWRKAMVSILKSLEQP